jgi:DNA polymerase-1
MSLDGTQLHLVETLDEAMAFKRWLGERHVNNAIAIDTETTGLNPRERGAAIRLIQFGDTQQGWSIPWQDWRGLALEAMREFDGQQVYHNSAFEMKWIHEHSAYRIPRSRSVDTMIAAHIINPLGAGGLKPLAAKYVDRRAGAGQNILHEAMNEHGWTWATIPVNFGPYHEYAALDTVLTAQLWDKFKGYVGPGSSYQQVFDLEMAVRFVVSGMEERGALIDLAYSEDRYAYLTDIADRISEWAEAAFKINIASNTQLGETLIGLGGELFDFTPTGQPKVDKYTLTVLSDPDNDYPAACQTLAAQALRSRRARKFASTYFRNFIEQNVGGYIHADIRTLGARTARMSVGQPALQQLPKNNSLVRNAFIPREGNTLVTCDYSQIEMRLLAEASRDKDLQAAFNTADETGGDFFVEMGKQIYADPSFEKSDKRRGLIKGTMYGSAYGAGVAKMAETAGVPVPRMQVVVDSIAEKFPGIKGFMSEIESKGVEREYKEGEAYVITPIGRRLPADKGKVYALTNYYLQSWAADVLKKALVRLDAAGYDEFLILPVHDEVVLDIPKDYAEQALRDVPLIMQELDHAVPLTAESEGGLDRWGEKYK